jgi:fructose-1,6-bisphosphatase-3
MDTKYLKLLTKEYNNIEAASTEIINLGAICCLPKGTEYFFSDLHGEYEAFSHLLRSASGVIKTKIEDIFSQSIGEQEREELANLIYYPERFMKRLNYPKIKAVEWQKIIIYRLILVCKEVSSKYTRSKVRKKMPKEFAYILDELLHADHDVNKENYYKEIIESIVDNQIAYRFITSICELIRNLSVDSLHIIGDIFDRGPRADIIMNELIDFHDVDVQWGNHDISWMGAATGNRALIANVIRIALSYHNFDVLEDGYGFNLRALAVFASEVYKDDPCTYFIPKTLDENKYAIADLQLASKMHKAITVIQHKLEGQLLLKHPEYDMAHRNCLANVDLENRTVKIGDDIYHLREQEFPTIDPEDPLKLNEEEESLMDVIAYSFEHSELLHKHISFLYQKGSMYKCVNGNLLYHGCIPMTEEGEFETFQLDGKTYKGKSLLDLFKQKAKDAYFLKKGSKQQEEASDFMWYMWCSPKSPLFGKSKLSAFEQAFVEEEESYVEEFNPYYKLSREEETCKKILREFHMDEERAHIVNGHVPVKMKQGESPVKANGKLFVIDGGISKSSQLKTGIAGYTLIYNSKTLSLAEHRRFTEDENGFYCGTPKVEVVEIMESRVTVGDTEIGKVLKEKIKDLKELVRAYRKGVLKENEKY